MKKWKIEEDGKYDCGQEQDTDHLFKCPLLPTKCWKDDVMTTTDISDKTTQIDVYWQMKGI